METLDQYLFTDFTRWATTELAEKNLRLAAQLERITKEAGWRDTAQFLWENREYGTAAHPREQGLIVAPNVSRSAAKVIKDSSEIPSFGISRRDALKLGTILVGGVVVTAGASKAEST